VKTVNYEDNSDECFFEFQESKTGHVYDIDEVGLYFSTNKGRAAYINNLAFEGQTAAGDWENIWTIDSGLHKGWNRKQFLPAELPGYTSFRFRGSEKGACAVGEVEVKGKEVMDQEFSDTICTPKVTVANVTRDLSEPIVYSSDSTPVLTAMSKSWGTVLGGDELELDYVIGTSSAGRMLDEADGTATVLIDDRTCTVTETATGKITCVTSDKPFVAGDESRLDIRIQGLGSVATRGQVFRYVQRWSDTQSWGGLPPMEGDAVHVPKGMHLLVDVDETPHLSLVSVEGSLIFDETARAFNSDIIFVKNGLM